MYKQELHVWYFSPYFFEEDEMGRTCGMYGEKTNTCGFGG
jgi:hypothetical protein